MNARFQFLHSSRWLAPTLEAKRRTAAARHGARFVYERDRAAGKWVSYIDAPSQGRDADVALVQAVLAEVDGTPAFHQESR